VSAVEDIDRVDVVILGGGLAGLTLALQLRQRLPDLSITVLERREHPVPHAAHKVGESTVEIGAHYFHAVLGLRKHLQEDQLRKFGFRFFFSDAASQFDATLELGASTYLPTPSFQLDRGIFENYLAEHIAQHGVTFIDGASVRNVELAPDSTVQPHQIRYTRKGREHTVHARWVVDASGRAGLLKRQLHLAMPNGHDGHAAWFRIGTKIDIDTWSDDAKWLQRCDPPYRWLSTNHLCGEGYWAWLIPLASGSHSVGVVWDAKYFALEDMNTFEKVMVWLGQHQPSLARDLEVKKHLLQDFSFLRNFSYGCKQVFSAQRWALTGEAGLFLDPFYSPGSDFIAISNTYITDLIERDLRGEALTGRAHVYQQLYFSFYESTLTLYKDQYGLFGDPEVLSFKVIWDYTFYWGILCQLFFQERLTDVSNIAYLSQDLQRAKTLNEAMQPFFRDWSQHTDKRSDAVLFDQAALPWFVELNRGLRDQLTEEGFRARIKAHVRLLESLAHQITSRAADQSPALDVSSITKLIDGASVALDRLLFSNAA
jgi:flavin-dependent dehydrogenase